MYSIYQVCKNRKFLQDELVLLCPGNIREKIKN